MTGEGDTTLAVGGSSGCELKISRQYGNTVLLNHSGKAFALSTVKGAHLTYSRLPIFIIYEKKKKKNPELPQFYF